MDIDAAAEIAQLVAVLQAPAGSQWLAVDRHRLVAADRLHERDIVEHVEHHDGTATRSRQAQPAIAAGADAQRQTLSLYSSFAFNVPDD